MTRNARASERHSGPILVTGGAGFIGSHLVEVLLARGAEVRVLDDLSSGRASHLPQDDPNLELRIGDMLDPDATLAAMKGARACVHLAAQPGPARPGADPYEATLGNILGFLNVLEAARVHRITRVVYASSASVYGDADAPFTEATTPRPVTPEGMEKLVAEGYAELYARRHGLHALGLRYFNVYGPRQEARGPHAGVVARCLARLEARRPALLHGHGLQTRDFVHVADAAAATAAALASGCRGVCNVASGQPTTLRELVELLGDALRQRALAQFAPPRAADVEECWADIRRLREVVGYAPVHALRAGLEALAAERETQRPARRTATVAVLPLHRSRGQRPGRGAPS